jgi:hypothetical protein
MRLNGAVELTRNLPRPRSLDPDVTDRGPNDADTLDERIVLVARKLSRLTDKTQKRCAPPRLPIEFTYPYQAVWYGYLL